MQKSLNFRRATITFRFLRVLLRTLLKLIFKIEIKGLENLPRNGGYILAGNHLSGWLDPFLMLAFCPATPRIYFIAAAEEVLKPEWRRFFTERIGGVIPIERNRGTAGREVLEKVSEVLKGGGVLGIFPEGDVSPEETGHVMRLKKGVGHFAVRANCPIVPVAFHGTKELYVGKSVQMIIGEPIPARTGGREAVEQQVAATAEAIEAILPPPPALCPTCRKPLRNFLTNLFIQEENELNRAAHKNQD